MEFWKWLDGSSKAKKEADRDWVQRDPMRAPHSSASKTYGVEGHVWHTSEPVGSKKQCSLKAIQNISRPCPHMYTAMNIKAHLFLCVLVNYQFYAKPVFQASKIKFLSMNLRTVFLMWLGKRNKTDISFCGPLTCMFTDSTSIFLRIWSVIQSIEHKWFNFSCLSQSFTAD